MKGGISNKEGRKEGYQGSDIGFRYVIACEGRKERRKEGRKNIKEGRKEGYQGRKEGRKLRGGR